MKNHKSLFKLILIFILLFSSVPVQTYANTVSESSVDVSARTLLEKAQERADVMIELYQASSVQYALIKDGEILISGSAGEKSLISHEKVEKDTMFGIGSISKVHTTAAIMKLVEAGKLKLDTSVVSYLPEFKMKDERYKKITVRMLVDHSSGLNGTSSYGMAGFASFNENFKQNFLRGLENQNLKADPGSFSVYCNDGFTLAEILIEKISGQQFNVFMFENFYQPLGLLNTKTPLDDFDREQLLKTYLPNFPDIELPAESLNSIGAGGIYSTAEDLVNFSQIFMKDSKSILSASSVATMMQSEFARGIWPDLSDSSIDYGVGWDSVRLFPFNNYGVKALSKGGDTIFYHSSIVVLPEHNMAMAVLASGSSSLIAQTFASETLLDCLIENGIVESRLPNAQFAASKKVPVAQDELEFTGNYINNTSLINIDFDEDKLLVTVPGVDGYSEEYFYCDDNAYYNDERTLRLNFEVEENGEIYLRQRMYQDLPGLGQFAMNDYAFQKIELEKLDADSEKLWVERNEKAYLLLNEEYNSIFFCSSAIVAGIAYNPITQNYMGSFKITDGQSAESFAKIPGLTGRDSSSIHLYTQDGVEFLDAGGFTFVDKSAVQNLYKGEGVVSIQENGFNRWLSIGEDTAGKTLTVECPENAMFAVYDETFSLVYSSFLFEGRSVTLPENGIIVFVGDVSAKFLTSIE